MGRVFFPGTPFDPFRAPIWPTIMRPSAVSALFSRRQAEIQRPEI
jgi:hypothetical protein